MAGKADKAIAEMQWSKILSILMPFANSEFRYKSSIIDIDTQRTPIIVLHWAGMQIESEEDLAEVISRDPEILPDLDYEINQLMDKLRRVVKGG